MGRSARQKESRKGAKTPRPGGSESLAASPPQAPGMPAGLCDPSAKSAPRTRAQCASVVAVLLSVLVSETPPSTATGGGRRHILPRLHARPWTYVSQPSSKGHSPENPSSVLSLPTEQPLHQVPADHASLPLQPLRCLHPPNSPFTKALPSFATCVHPTFV